MTLSRFLTQSKVYWFLFIFVLVSWFLADIFEKKPDEKMPIVAHSPDYFSVGYRKEERSIDGIVKNELIADKLIHYSDDGTTHLESPVMTLFGKEQSPWIITSQTGVLQPDRDHLSLEGQVHISREGKQNLKHFEINTTYLNVTLSTSYAETTQWAEIIEGSNKTQGVGMKFTFAEPIYVEFLSKVKGHYEIK